MDHQEHDGLQDVKEPIAPGAQGSPLPKIGGFIRKACGSTVYRLLYTILACSRRIRSEIFASGFAKSAWLGKAVDRRGHALPWYSYPAISFFETLDWRDKTICEFGAGQSTVWWSSIARRVIALESDQKWCETLRNMVGERVVVQYAPHLSDMLNFPDADVYIVDCYHNEWRGNICDRLLDQNLSGKIVILDDAEHNTDSMRRLREASTFHVELFGFCPGESPRVTATYWF